MDYKHHIETKSEVRFGKPCIKGTRISVDDVLGWLANRMTTVEILTDFPELTVGDIQACKVYSRKHNS
jgi:uncharacterized protein (DUF433 family)